MKEYTLQQALSEMTRLFPALNVDDLSKIEYEDGSKNKFNIQFDNDKKAFINLDAGTISFNICSF